MKELCLWTDYQKCNFSHLITHFICKEKGEDDKSRTTLCRLQQEIDKLLAPLTPSAVTPHHEEIINYENDDEEIEFANEDQG